MATTEVELISHCHGKERVRVGRTWREGDVHYFVEWTVGVSLDSEMDHAFVEGSNKDMTATDTCKNTVYVIAKRLAKRASPEEFAVALSSHMVETYPKVFGCRVTVEEMPWTRVHIDGKPHNHGFAMAGTERRTVKVYKPEGKPAEVTSGIVECKLLKTTQSGYEGYLKDEYTSLKDTTERIVATSVTAIWTYVPDACESGQCYNGAYQAVKAAMFDKFYGPADKGVYSPSVQYTLHEMAKAALGAVPDIVSISLTMPNLHFVPAAFPQGCGLKFDDDVYVATSEPHGNIVATVGRKSPGLKPKL